MDGVAMKPAFGDQAAWRFCLRACAWASGMKMASSQQEAKGHSLAQCPGQDNYPHTVCMKKKHSNVLISLALGGRGLAWSHMVRGFDDPGAWAAQRFFFPASLCLEGQA
jgi:hypothetical protein